MSGIRENTRTAKRSRPSDALPRMAPPVLFRFPSVGAALPESPTASAANASLSHTAAPAMPTYSPMAPPAAEPIAGVSPPVSPAALSAEQLTASRAAAAAMAEEKAAGQRLLNVLIVMLLLAALVVITWISLKQTVTGDDLAQGVPDAALEQLVQLEVPEVQPGTPAPADQVASAQTEATPATEGLSSGLALNSDNSIAPSPQAQPESAIAGLDNTSIEPSATPSAQIQLRPPVPMSNSLSLAARGAESGSFAELTLPADGQDLDLSPPGTRAETVSNPKDSSLSLSSPTAINDANRSSSSASPATSSSTITSDTANSGKPRTATTSGASPSLWDGAATSPNTSPSVPSSGSSLDNTASNSAATSSSGFLISDPLTARMPVTSSSDASKKPATSSASAGSSALANDQAVTVGGGASEPYNLATTRATSTPDFDSVATIEQYQSYAQQKRLASGPSSTLQGGVQGAGVSPPAQGADVQGAGVSPPARQPINSLATGANAPIAGQRSAQNPYVKGSPVNSYVASGQVPYAVTGQPSGPYVPNGGLATMPGGQAAAGTGPAPMPGQMMPGQMMPGQMMPGQMVPGQMMPGQMVPGQMVTGPNSGPPASLPGYSLPPRTQAAPGPYGPPQSGYPGGAGYPNASYPTPSYTPPNASMPTRQVPGYMPPGVQGAASYPVSNPYPGGQPVPGLMGPNGFATQPSGDFAPPRPVMGTMGSNVSMPNGIH